ncbi:monocyte to macrophage differentiation factor 2a isoform X2 [Scyliorhinus canicula]|uniref:monocyte to macrophage differentiation factor 2a isoform X2 n=1 Tax=Scyliorhinus canicula TaxID=7830 RepID=UPI0018F2DD57|nr:monocyte to macrophage differentiation factor 2a isoform X2 [Scyliorhinus canicula]
MLPRSAKTFPPQERKKMMNFRKTKFARFMNSRVPANRRYEPTEYEHAANCATHAFWIIPSILGSSILCGLSDDQWEMISAWIYGFGLCGLFIVSTVFHTISWKKSHFRTMEHCFHMFDRMVIYFFIAASYAPWLNLRELGPWASHMRWIIWMMACVGTVYVFQFHERLTLMDCLNCWWVVSSTAWECFSSRAMAGFPSHTQYGISLWPLEQASTTMPSGGICTTQPCWK